MGDWNLIEMLSNVLGNRPNTVSRQMHNEFVEGGTGGQGYMPAAQASPMAVRAPTIPDSTLPRPEYTAQSPNPFPMTTPIRSADNTPGVPRAARGVIDQYLSQLRGEKRPMPGTRLQRFANIPQPGPGGEFFRNF